MGKWPKCLGAQPVFAQCIFNDTAVCVRSPCHGKVYWLGSIKMSCHQVIGVLLCVGWVYMCTHSTYVYVCVSMTLYVCVRMRIHNMYIGMCVYICVWMVCGYHMHVLFVYM